MARRKASIPDRESTKKSKFNTFKSGWFARVSSKFLLALLPAFNCEKQFKKSLNSISCSFKTFTTTIFYKKVLYINQ